jgi:hypothetical protein
MLKATISIVKRDGLLYALGIAFFFVLVRYRGYAYDAALYLLQVINYLQPERFVNDVPFMYGNQDSFSIFSPIVAEVFKILGVNVGGIVATLFMLLALGLSLITLVCRWTKLFNAEQWRFPIVLALFVMLASKEYGAGCLYFSFFEPFLVARVLSEVLIVIGLIYLFDKNKYISLAFFIMSSLFHPLMGGWALPLWLFFHFPRFRIPVLILAFLSPLSGYLHIGRLDFYPNDWKPLYIRPDLDDSFIYMGLLLFWWAMYHHFKGRSLSKFSICLLLVSLVAFYLQYAGVYMEHLLFYQAQPFRMQWLCTIPVIPVFALFIHDCLKNKREVLLCDYAVLILGMCVIARLQWPVLFILCLIFICSPIGKKNIIAIPSNWSRMLFVLGLVFLLANTMFCNFIQLALEQGIGNTGLAVEWLHIPAYLTVVENTLLLLFVLVCASQKKYGFALIFAVALGNGDMKILPIVGILIYLLPNMSYLVKRGLLAFSFAFSFFEVLSSTYLPNSTEELPLENAAVASVLLFVIIFMASCWIMALKKNNHGRNVFVPLLVFLVSLLAWDVFRWDSRNEIIVLNEKQMDAFFDAPIFPQVKNRGKILFTVDHESPNPSRMNFMTGAYADKSIGVGEIFYKEQYMESRRRQSELLVESPLMLNLSDFGDKIMDVYLNPDTLLARVHYLCDAGEIAHFATDYANMPLPKQDSVYLEVRQKFVWLYGCPSN